VHLIASQPRTLLQQPVHEAPGKSKPTELRTCHDVVTVENMAPDKEVTGSEASGSGRMLLSRQEGPHEPEALRTLESVDPIRKVRFGAEPRAQLQHHPIH
jgi:hypothetical protein